MKVDKDYKVNNLLYIKLIIRGIFKPKLSFICTFNYMQIRMDKKTVLITGANCGLGLESAKDFAKRGARVIMACRSIEKANKARGELSAASVE